MNDDTGDFVPREAQSHYVYYCYAADDTLLYIGQTWDPDGRVAIHNNISTSMWMFFDCTEVVISDPMSRADALALERAEISTHCPLHNRQYNPNRVDSPGWVPGKPRGGAMPAMRWLGGDPRPTRDEMRAALALLTLPEAVA